LAHVILVGLGTKRDLRGKRMHTGGSPGEVAFARFVLVAELNRGRGSVGVWKRPVVVDGLGPLTGRVSTGIHWKVGRVMPGSAMSAIATRPRGVTSSTGVSSVAVGSFTGSAVSIMDGGPARERRD
jgi:hypothetical protein